VTPLHILVGAGIIAIGLTISIGRWAVAVPRFGRWFRRRFPRAANVLVGRPEEILTRWPSLALPGESGAGEGELEDLGGQGVANLDGGTDPGLAAHQRKPDGAKGGGFGDAG
jgi:hypothetical protein